MLKVYFNQKNTNLIVKMKILANNLNFQFWIYQNKTKFTHLKTQVEKIKKIQI